MCCYFNISFLDYDECANATDNNCTQICSNEGSGYMCSCYDGCSLTGDGYTCIGKWPWM